MDRFEDITGKRFNNLVVLEFLGSKKHQRWWKCQCDCGKTTVVGTAQLNRGATKSCGCLIRRRVLEACTKHNQGRKGEETTTYSTWLAMRGRCRNKNNSNYKRYGGRGITISPEWDDFVNFYKDMGDKPKGKSLDRIDNNKGYSKENCRWTTPSEQVRNSTKTILKIDEVVNIKMRIGNGETDKYIAEVYKVGRHVINKIRHNLTWKEVSL